MLSPSPVLPASIPQPRQASTPPKSTDAKRRLEYNRTSHSTLRVLACPTAQRAFNEIGEVIHIACDQWKCEYCQRVLAWRWAERVRYGIALWPGPAYFWTLTLPGWVKNPSRGYEILPRRWQNLAQTMRRETGEFQYAAFVEAHPHRMEIPHFHVISLRKAPTRLKDMAVTAGFGHQAKELEINGRMAASYVSKYTSKQGRQMPKGFRRVRISQAWPRLPEPLYPIKVLPMKRAEPLDEYIHRVSRASHTLPSILLERWLNPASDIL